MGASHCLRTATLENPGLHGKAASRFSRSPCLRRLRAIRVRARGCQSMPDSVTGTAVPQPMLGNSERHFHCLSLYRRFLSCEESYLVLLTDFTNLCLLRHCAPSGHAAC